MNDVIYLDHAAATPLDSDVLAAMQPYFSNTFYNPSSPYAPAVAVRQDYEAARAKIAGFIGAKPAEIIMTAGATESINLAIRGVSGHVVVPAAEHESVLAAARGGENAVVAVDDKGRVSPAAIEQAIRPDTRLVSVALANGELGTIQPLAEIAAVVKAEREKRRKAGSDVPIYLHSDASQGAGLLGVNVARLGVDLLTINAGKLYGPKQVGLLWVERSVRLSPQIVGGGQERGLRSGTENVAGAIGFSRALELAEQRRKVEIARLADLRDSLEAQLSAALPQMVVLGDVRHRLASHLSVAFPGIDGERLVFALESGGVLVSTGSACAANRGTRSHVLEAIGLTDEVADGSLRISLGRLSDEVNTKRAGELIIEAVKREYQRLG